MDTTQLLLIAGLIALALSNVVTLVLTIYLHRQLRSRPVPKHFDVHVDGTRVFDQQDMAEVQKRADAELEQAVSTAAQQLEASVNRGVQQLSAHVNEAAATSISQEFEKYQANLRALNNQTVQEFANIQHDLDEQRTQLQQQLITEINQERERRLAHFNDRINDVVASYLAEALGNRVDLGSQTAYILASLDQHKDDIKKDILT